MWQQLLPALRITAFMTVLTGLIYPLAVTGLAQVFFPGRANGSLVKRNGRIIGSSLIGQKFAKPEYFHPRPSAAGNDGYDGMSSGGSNFGPTSQKLAERVQKSVEQFRKENPTFTGAIPADAVTASASGLDPHISPASADAQLARVASARQIPPQQLHSLITLYTERPDLGLLGEARVNVLLLNLDLDRKFPAAIRSQAK
jgi:K+-transporting ATPase ATPase C chain